MSLPPPLQASPSSFGEQEEKEGALGGGPTPN